MTISRVALTALLGLAITARPTLSVAADSTEIDRVVKDACSRQVVLLGEDPSHGGGRTIEVKVLLVTRLLAECGFTAVLFESQFYDFLDFERDLRAGRATRQGLADAIGALWSRGLEFQPLIDRLHSLAGAGKIRLGGIDPQVGGITGRYSQQRLGADLASVLQTGRRADCAVEFNRHHVWGYDTEHPFDDPAKARLRACITEVRSALFGLGDQASADLAAAVGSYVRYAEMTLDGDTDARDLGMFENLRWHRARWPPGEKVIVWTATTHAAKAAWPAAPWRPLGARVRASGVAAFTIGFTALGGSYGRPGGRGTPTLVDAPPPGSLEARAMDGFPHDLRYLGLEELTTMVRVSGRALGYAKPQTLDWSEVLDGVIVLRAETPPRALP